jgi:ribose 1,5-bisphosphokinase
MPIEQAARRTGARLYYVMGASGAGKDSLLGYARQRLADRLHIVFAHRYITRPSDSGGENHVALSMVEFEMRRRLGCFALDWQAHGNGYGIGCEIDLWLSLGIDVVINGSRGHFPQAASRYANLVGILVEAAPAILAERLHLRGREVGSEIGARLQRAANDELDHHCLVRLRNDGPLQQAGENLVRILAVGGRKPP